MSIVPVYFSELTVNETKQKVPYLIRYSKHSNYNMPHRHNFIEFCYVIQGVGSETINNYKHELKPGNFSLVLPYQVHALHTDTEKPVSFYTGAITLDAFFVSGEFWTGFADILLRLEDGLPACHAFEGADKLRMDAVMAQMMEAYEEKGIRGELMFKAKLVEAILLFDKARSQNSIPSSTHTIRKFGAEAGKKNIFWSVVHYIHSHCTEPILLQDLARKFNTSPSYISTAFKKHFGVCYSDFINEVRLQNACALLVSSEISILDIAFEAGFESYSTFSRVFRKVKGMTAQEYRKNHFS